MKLMPQEIEVRYILPALRKELALALSKDLKQKEIASILNITPAAVSQYIKDKRGQTKLNIDKEIEISKNKIIKNRFSAQTELLRLLKIIKKTHAICDIHRTYDCIPEKCNICFEKW